LREASGRCFNLIRIKTAQEKGVARGRPGAARKAGDFLRPVAKKTLTFEIGSFRMFFHSALCGSVRSLPPKKFYTYL
jgi:hypothetical protein